ncbi:methionyl-tRNA formyltransferase [Streptomyces monomycini]|uniref:methionyl-tRNA formyltransferase n=1 Tax=Streptomyces monomycini TaxID=371720 RepID=UPI00067A917C|nr:methionyl-tRNA formyltransferase [Streptomyces monomycini]
MTGTACRTRVLGPHAPGRPLRIGVLASATGGNLRTLLSLRHAEPDRFHVCLVASHGQRVKALDVAREAGVEAWDGDFDAHCGSASQAAAAGPDAVRRYRDRARSWHDRLDVRLRSWEECNGPLDLVVLAYHRWIEGELLNRYAYRMVNQHPGDLSMLAADGSRTLTGKDPVRLAMSLGHRTTRTSCFLVDASQDGGAVLCMGPPVPVGSRRPTVEDAWQQELLQKERSDRPCLEWTVRAFAAGRLAVDAATHADGSRVVLVDGEATPLGGKRLDDTDD